MDYRQRFISAHLISNKIKAGLLEAHAWWFDISRAGVYSYDYHKESFEIVK